MKPGSLVFYNSNHHCCEVIYHSGFTSLTHSQFVNVIENGIISLVSLSDRLLFAKRNVIGLYKLVL